MTLYRYLVLGALLPLCGCYGLTTAGLTTGVMGTEEDPGVVTPPPEDLRLVGAAGRDLTEFWEILEVPLSQNAKMLGFDMMKSEVMRATGLSWLEGGADQWERNRDAFGAADYRTNFSEDLTPSQQKLVLWRKMAYQVCQDAVARDAGRVTRVLFTEVDPALPISTSNAAVNAQLDGLYRRFFLDPPPAADLALASGLLAAAFADGGDPKEAWRDLCVGLLGSMKFLTY